MKQAKLNLLDLTMIVVSLVIGMGIFKTPVIVAREAGTVNLFFIAWLVGGFIALCGALTFAEIGSRFPVTGAYYKIFSTCYHPSVAFAINCIILVSNAASVAGVSLIGSEYLANILFRGNVDIERMKVIIAAIAIVIFYGVNLMGLKMSARTQNVLTIIKIGLVLMLILAVFTVTGSLAHTNSVPDSHPGLLSSFKALGVCLIAVSFSFGGYQQTINFGGEMKNAVKLIPRGIFYGIGIIVTLYLLINYTYYRVIGFEDLKSAQSIAAILAGSMFGDKGFTILSILLFLSVLAYVNVLLMSNPRVMYAMSEEGVLPAIFSRKSSRTGSLIISLTTFAALCLVTLFYAKNFDEILSHTIFLDCIGMATAGAAIFIIRKRTAHLDKQSVYSMRLYPLPPLIFICTYLFVGISIAINTPKAAVVSLIIFCIFFVLYFILKKSLAAPVNGVK